MKRFFSSRWGGYTLGIVLVIATTLIGELIKMLAIVDATNMDMLYILSVVISAIYLGFGVSIMISILGVLTFDFFFLPTYYTFTVDTQQEMINLLILLVVSLVISLLSSRIMR